MVFATNIIIITRIEDKKGEISHTQRYKLSWAKYCKLALARFSTLLRIQDRADCGKGTELHCTRSNLGGPVMFPFFILRLNVLMVQEKIIS